MANWITNNFTIFLIISMVIYLLVVGSLLYIIVKNIGKYPNTILTIWSLVALWSMRLSFLPYVPYFLCFVWIYINNYWLLQYVTYVGGLTDKYFSTERVAGALYNFSSVAFLAFIIASVLYWKGDLNLCYVLGYSLFMAMVCGALWFFVVRVNALPKKGHLFALYPLCGFTCSRFSMACGNHRDWYSDERMDFVPVASYTFLLFFMESRSSSQLGVYDFWGSLL